LLEELVMICCFHGLDYKGAAPRVRARAVWAALIALGQAGLFPRGLNPPANQIIWGVDLRVQVAGEQKAALSCSLL
jgi:hypothetical protein